MYKHFRGFKKTFIMTHQWNWFILLLAFFTLGQADGVCQEIYQDGFYDPCMDVNCNFYCPSTSNKQVTVADPEDCQKYFLCLDGHLLPQRCPDGQRFNANIHACRQQSNDYDKCQPPCRDDQYKNFILMQTSSEKTTNPTTEKHRIAVTTTSMGGADSTAYSETPQKETFTTLEGSDILSSAKFMPEMTTTLSRIKDSPATNLTNLCVNLSSDTSDEDVIELLCEWVCEAEQIVAPAKFQWYKNGILLSNTSYLCANNEEEDDDDSNNDDETEPCFIAERSSNGSSSSLKINASEEYEGIYQCSVLSSQGRNYSSNIMPLAPLLVLNWTQKMDLNASVVVVTCGLQRSDGRPVSQRLCDGYFQWNASDYKEVNSSRCSHNIEVKVDFRENSTISCQWKSANYFGLPLYHAFLVPQVNDVCLPDFEYGIFWNAVYVDSSIEKSCPKFPQAFARRSCILNGANKPEWTMTDFRECTYEEFQKVFYGLKAIEHNQTDYPIIPSLARDLMTITQMGNLDSPNLNITIQCLKLLTNIRSDNNHRSEVSDDEIKSVMGIVSNTLEGSNMNSWNALRKSDADIATAIMKTIDLYLVRIGSTENVFQSNLAIKVSRVPENSDDVLKIQPTQHNFNRNDPSYDNVSLSMDFFKSDRPSFVTGSPNQSRMVYTALYTNLEDILPVQKNNSYLASRIMMIKTSNPQLSWINGGMNITFANNLRNISDPFLLSCVFWNFSLGQNGEWSSMGCRVLNSNENATTCSCDHMTNFAILMTIDQEVLVDNVAIRTISLIGCIISIVSLFLTIVILAISWKRANMTHHYAILINLCVALIIANVVFIAGIDKTQPREVCITVATLLHLFFMAAFFLMLAEGVQLLLYVVHVFHVQRRFETVIIITSAWVLAVVVVGISLGVSGTEGYGTSKHCWLSSSQGLVWAFIGPALFIILINLCILFVVLYKASRKKAASEKQDIKSQMKRAVWNMVVISPLLGITWVFGVLSVSSSLVVFQYIFAVVNSLQGLFIFIFHGFYRQLRLKRSEIRKRKTNRFEQMNAIFDTLPNAYLSNDCELPVQTFEAKNAMFYGYQTNEANDPSFETVYGSQSTESSYVGSVSSQ